MTSTNNPQAMERCETIRPPARSMSPLHEPVPLTPSLSPTGGEGRVRGALTFAPINGGASAVVLDATGLSWSMRLSHALPDPGSIDVWRVWLSEHMETARECFDCLSIAERKCAGRFVRALDRDRFVARRVVLRQILAAYTKVDPARLRFREGFRGKLELIDSPDDQAVHFNLSHSAGLALYAVSGMGPVGIDVEKIGRIAELEGLVRSCLTWAEQTGLNRLESSRRLATFHRIWTCKEAVLKALGDGIGDGFNRVETRLSVEGVPCSCWIGGTTSADSWSLWHLAPVDGWAATVALHGHGAGLRCGRIDPGQFPVTRPDRARATDRRFS
jgi:4'-phosphopantetheinyl transferase